MLKFNAGAELGVCLEARMASKIRVAGRITLSFLLAIPAAVVAQQQKSISRLLVFPEATQVRIECRLSPSPDEKPVSFDAEIARADTGEVLWTGPLGSASPTSGKMVTVSNLLTRLAPEQWEPAHPILYRLSVRASRDGNVLDETVTRFGFRSITITNGQFYLNGRPIFLRGVAINPPGRTIPEKVGESPEFAHAYINYLKQQNVNIIRIATDCSQTWFDACDELGMMVYAGRYGLPPGADEKKGPPPQPEASIAAYRELFEWYVNHPSIILYYLANELPVSGERGQAFSNFLTQAYSALHEFDSTRPFIANAGYGEGREGDVCDVHRYWGWYYNSFLTYYNLRDRIRGEPLFGGDRNQPLTFTECVGAFTGSSGEFNLVRSKQLAPRLGWIGATEEPVEDALGYQSALVKEATESFRRMRPLNPRLAGVMPFTIFFYNWAGITNFDQMHPKPALDQLRVSYQPTLLSWELWTRQVYAGTRIRPFVHVVNDSDAGKALTNAILRYGIQTRDGRSILSSSTRVPDVNHFETCAERLDITVPKDLLTGEYTLVGTIERDGLVLSTNWMDLFVAESAWGRPPLKFKGPVYIYDRSERTASALDRLGIKTSPVKSVNPLPKSIKVLVIGEDAWDNHLFTNRAALRSFVQSGGRILCLAQQPLRFPTDWLPSEVQMLRTSANDPAYPPVSRPHREQSHVNIQRPSHPVFIGLDRKRMALWSDYTQWDQTQRGFPRVYPVTSGFRLMNPEDLAHTAVLADYDRGLEGVALCEMYDGEGSVMLSGFDLASRTGLDPAADRLLLNLVYYASAPEGHDPLPLLTRPITWGDLPSEQGVVCGPMNGLVINAEWVRGETQQGQEPLPDNTGSWNMRPGDQFVPSGRNPFGLYSYSTGSNLRDPDPASETGVGFFFTRSPASVTRLVTTARNPAAKPAKFRMFLNKESVETTIAPGAEGTLRLDLPLETKLLVRFIGPKTLVLVETHFE